MARTSESLAAIYARLRSADAQTAYAGAVAAANDAPLLDDADIFLREGELNIKLALHPMSPAKRRLWRALNSAWYTWSHCALAIFYLGLAVFEAPHLWSVPLAFTVVMQFVVLAALVVDLVLRLSLYGRQFGKEAGLTLGVIAIVCLVVDLLLYLLHIEEPKYHLLRALRPLYLLKTAPAADVRRLLWQIFKTGQRVIDILVLLFFYVGMFSIMGVYLYSDDPANWYFADLGSSFVQMFVLLTTSNFPDIMLPAYAQSRWNCVFFIAFIVGGIYFIANLVLAIIYQHFTMRERHKFRRLLLHRRRALRSAYAAVTAGGVTPFTESLLESLLKLNRPSMTKLEVHLLFSALDTDFKGFLLLDDFYELYDALELRWQLPQQLSAAAMPGLLWLARTAERDALQLRLTRMLESRPFDIFVHVITIAQACFVYYEASRFSGPENDHSRFKFGELAFFMVFLVEMLSKFAVFGSNKFWRQRWNRFDSVMLFFGAIGVFVAFAFSSRYGASVIVFRTFRVMRLLAARESFNHIVETAWTVLPRLGRFAATLMCVYYSAAIIGMACFAMTTSVYCPYDAAINPCGSEYANAPPGYPSQGFGHYQLVSFDDIARSFVTLFSLMVVNNWNSTMAGHVAATHAIASMFFICFYVFCVLIVLNVVEAFILEAFQVVVVGDFLEREDTNPKHGVVRGNDGYAATGKYADNSVFHQQFLTRRVVLVASEAKELLPADHPGIFRLQSPGSKEHIMGSVVFLGKRGLTHLTLVRLLYKDEIPEWFAEDDAADVSAELSLTPTQLFSNNNSNSNSGPPVVTVYSDAADSDAGSERSFSTTLLHEVHPVSRSFVVRNPAFDSNLRP